MPTVASTPGMHTEAEIRSEPLCWTQCLQALKENGQIEQALHGLSRHRHGLFVGCGSSYYLALAAAASWTRLTGLPARAVPASELLLFPDLVPSDGSPFQPVLISRSGHTSEVLEAAEYLKSKGVRAVAITCARDQPIQTLSAATVCLAPADEKSMVMTRSFTSMLMGLQFLAAKFANNTGFIDCLESVALSLGKALDSVASRVRSFVQAHDFADYVCLGQGPYYGLACEGALKITEMSCSYAQSYHTLEFRHGPKAVTGPETLIVFLLSGAGLDAERKLLEEVKSLGGTTLVVTNKADEKTRRVSDLLLELNLQDTDEYARLAAHIIPGQLLGLYTGLKKGLDPDRPRNLSRVVILDDRS